MKDEINDTTIKDALVAIQAQGKKTKISKAVLAKALLKRARARQEERIAQYEADRAARLERLAGLLLETFKTNPDLFRIEACTDADEDLSGEVLLRICVTNNQLLSPEIKSVLRQDAKTPCVPRYFPESIVKSRIQEALTPGTGEAAVQSLLRDPVAVAKMDDVLSDIL